MLTHRQNELLGYIRSEIAETGFPPTFEAMAIAMNTKSKSVVHRIVTSLVERGYVERDRGVNRGLRVVRTRDDSLGLTAANDDVVDVPLLGAVSSTRALAGVEGAAGTVEVPGDVVSNREHFAHVAEGDTLRALGIVDGDVAVFRAQDDGRAGDVVAAVVDGTEHVVGRYRRNCRARVFETGDPADAPRSIRDHRVRVRGKLVTVLRRY